MNKTKYNKIEVPKNHVRKALDNKKNTNFIYTDKDSVVFAGEPNEIFTLLSMTVSSLRELVDDRLIKTAFALSFRRDELDKKLTKKELLEIMKEVLEESL